jgi:hypothetical protein
MVSRALVFLVALGTVSLAASPSPDEIVNKSVAATKADWAQAAKYSFVERDVGGKRSDQLSKTYRVLMIDGSPYNLVTAVNDQPLSPDEKAMEQRKLQKEIEKRQHESERQREHRVAKYEREQSRDHRMLQEMIDAFEFKLDGQEENVNGHACWVLSAEPRPGYEATDHEGRVLKGMKGRLWIDKATNQWVKVHAEVVKPVSMLGFLAKVGPGTEFDLEQEPVAGGVWLPKTFNVRVRASALGFLNENSDENETYTNYQPMPQALALLQSQK